MKADKRDKLDSEKALLRLMFLCDIFQDWPKDDRIINRLKTVDYTFSEFDALCKNLVLTNKIMHKSQQKQASL